MYIHLHVKCSLFVSDCNETFIFSTGIRTILKYQISRKFEWEPSCSLRTDGHEESYVYGTVHHLDS